MANAGVDRDPYTVTRLNREAKALLEASFRQVWVTGEISNLARPASGHAYFSLKDAGAQVRCALFRGVARTLGHAPRDGEQVLVRARVSLYEGRGDFQLIIQHLEEAGEGALRRAFEALKRRLDTQGLFRAELRRPLPVLPARIALITSPSGAAVRDVLSTLARRFPAIPVRLYPVPVQGVEAAPAIVHMLELAGRSGDCDALILARGGGSLEDLQPFNEETVARAIRACPIPVVTGVGHEVDLTIADLVADRRAATPTAAAETLSPDRREWLAGVRRQGQRLVVLMRNQLAGRAQHLDLLHRTLVHPRQRLAQQRARLTQLRAGLLAAQRHAHQDTALRVARLSRRLVSRAPAARLAGAAARLDATRPRLHQSFGQHLAGRRHQLSALGARLDTVSPLATLRRGYAVLEDADGAVIRAAAQTATGQALRARLGEGELWCRVEKIRS